MRCTRVAIALATAFVVFAAAQPRVAHADNLWLHSCAYYGNDDVGAGVWSTQQAFPPDYDFSQSDNCGSGGAFGIHTTQGPWGTHWEQWSTVSPNGINIDSAWTPPCSGGCATSQQGVLVNCNLAAEDYGAYFVWGPNQGSQRIINADGGKCPYDSGTLADGSPINTSFGPTHFFGFQLRCDKPNSQTCPKLDPGLGIRGIQLGATETAVPSISAPATGNLSHSGWVRGDGWKIGFEASDPSGVCDMRAWLNGLMLQGPATLPNQAYWDQCDPSGVPQQWAGPTVNTTNYADGTAFQLTYQAADAAGNWSRNVTTTSYVDNSPVTLALSGPADAPVTAGTQYVTATSSANRSGDAIVCQTDGGSWTGHAGTSAQIPVAGLGDHRVSCYAEDSAVDISGSPGRSAIQSRSLKIGEPVRSGISFASLSRTCRRVRVRTHHRITSELECHTASRQFRVAYLAHGQAVTVRGWFATADGAALSHVPVKIVAAPDDGFDHWRIVTSVSTASDGSWRARLPAGPSRLIEAIYGGGPLTEAAASGIAKVEVRASSTLSFSRIVHFGHFAYFAGRLLGGYVPQTGAIVVVQAFDRGHWRNIATVRTDRSGNWSARYAISGGSGRYPVRVRIPRQADYPWAAALTPSQTLVVVP
jgi:hypothetical protein